MSPMLVASLSIAGIAVLVLLLVPFAMFGGFFHAAADFEEKTAERFDRRQQEMHQRMQQYHGQWPPPFSGGHPGPDPQDHTSPVGPVEMSPDRLRWEEERMHGMPPEIRQRLQQQRNQSVP